MHQPNTQHLIWNNVKYGHTHARTQELFHLCVMLYLLISCPCYMRQSRTTHEHRDTSTYLTNANINPKTLNSQYLRGQLLQVSPPSVQKCAVTEVKSVPLNRSEPQMSLI